MAALQGNLSFQKSVIPCLTLHKWMPVCVCVCLRHTHIHFVYGQLQWLPFISNVRVPFLLVLTCECVCYYMPTKVWDWMCGIYVRMAVWSLRLAEGIPWVSSHALHLSLFEPADSRSMTAHLSDLMPNVSSTLQGCRVSGWRPEKEILGQWGKQEEREREPMERQRGGEKRGCMLGWRMRKGGEHSEYKWDGE